MSCHAVLVAEYAGNCRFWGMMDLQTKAVCQAKHSQTEVTAGMEQAGKLPSQFLIYSLDIKDRISEVKNFDFNYFQS